MLVLLGLYVYLTCTFNCVAPQEGLPIDGIKFPQRAKGLSVCAEVTRRKTHVYFWRVHVRMYRGSC
jgi:hypothetical protein